MQFCNIFRILELSGHSYGSFKILLFLEDLSRSDLQSDYPCLTVKYHKDIVVWAKFSTKFNEQSNSKIATLCAPWAIQNFQKEFYGNETPAFCKLSF